MGPKCSHKFLYEGSRGGSDTGKGDVITEARCYIVALKMEEETMSQGMLEKLRKQILP